MCIAIILRNMKLYYTIAVAALLAYVCGESFMIILILLFCPHSLNYAGLTRVDPGLE